MSKLEKFITRSEDIIASVVFALCGGSAVFGLLTGQKEVAGFAMIVLLVCVLLYLVMVFSGNLRRNARIRQARKRTEADMD